MNDIDRQARAVLGALRAELPTHRGRSAASPMRGAATTTPPGYVIGERATPFDVLHHALLVMDLDFATFAQRVQLRLEGR